MCGIFGVLGKKISIKKNLQSIYHRGPDDQGDYYDDSVSLGYRRLSIIDLSSKGNQPIYNETKSVVLFFNGEIYNYQDLTGILVKKGHRFISRSDTETLVHGYEEWGMTELLKKLNGMFAFCLYDKEKQEIYLVRDRIGKKPLYYYEGADYVAFSSETKAFFQLKDFSFDIDREVFSDWFGLSYLADNQKTIIRNVFKVPPGHFLTYNLGSNKLKFSRYWSLEKKKEQTDFAKTEDLVEKILIDSVQRRLIADVPAGILLSGGLDSSLITALASRYSTKKITTINVSFKNSIINEKNHALKVAKHCHTQHINLSLTVKSAYEELEKTIQFYDDLSTVDGGLFSTYLLSREVRKLGIKVILVGEGADEVFGGYSWFQIDQLPLSLLPEKAKIDLYYYALMRALPGRRFNHYSSILRRKMDEVNQSFFKKMQRYEICYSLPNHYCMKVDKGGSAASVEIRAPYLDYRLVELAYNIPKNFLLNGNFLDLKSPIEKYILRKIAVKYLPHEIVNRKKRGGMMPTDEMLTAGLKNNSQLILNNSYINSMFDKNTLTRLINQKSSFPPLVWQREWLLWKTLIFALWYEYFKKQYHFT